MLSVDININFYITHVGLDRIDDCLAVTIGGVKLKEIRNILHIIPVTTAVFIYKRFKKWEIQIVNENSHLQIENNFCSRRCQ